MSTLKVSNLRNENSATNNLVLGINGKVGVGTTVADASFYIVGNAAGKVVAVSTASTITIDMSTANNFEITLDGNYTIGNPSNLVQGQSGFIALTQDATGSRTVGWGTFWDWPAATAPTLSTGANSVDIVAYYVRTTTSIAADAIIGIG